MKNTDLSEILNQQPIGIAEITPVEGNYLYFNEQERLYRGLSCDEMKSVSKAFNGTASEIFWVHMQSTTNKTKTI